MSNPLKKIGKAVGGIVKGAFSFVKKALPYIAIGAAIWFTGGLAGAWAMPAWTGIGTAAGGAALGGAPAGLGASLHGTAGLSAAGTAVPVSGAIASAAPEVAAPIVGQSLTGPAPHGMAAAPSVAPTYASTPGAMHATNMSSAGGFAASRAPEEAASQIVHHAATTKQPPSTWGNLIETELSGTGSLSTTPGTTSTIPGMDKALPNIHAPTTGVTAPSAASGGGGGIFNSAFKWMRDNPGATLIGGSMLANAFQKGPQRPPAPRSYFGADPSGNVAAGFRDYRQEYINNARAKTQSENASRNPVPMPKITTFGGNT